MKKQKLKAFTMAEVLIAIAVIGVIAALVLPVMLKNYNNRIFATKARRAYTAIVDACSHGLSDDQVKYPGDIIDNHCQYIPGKSCTAENGSGTITLKDGTVITMTGWSGNPGGDLEVTIDTNAGKGPNATGKDIWTTKLTRDCKLADDGTAGTISYLKSQDWRISEEEATASEPELTEEEQQALALAKRRDFTKWTAETLTSGLSEDYCNSIKDQYGITECLSGGNDYWAAAVEKCGGVQNLPTESDLHALAQELYPGSCNDYDGTPTSSWTQDCTGTLDTSKLSEYPGLSGLGSSWSNLWSGSEYSSGNARGRDFRRRSSGR